MASIAMLPRLTASGRSAPSGVGINRDSPLGRIAKYAFELSVSPRTWLIPSY